MDLVGGALGKLPSKLLELLGDEYKLQTGVKDQITRLTRELESMHAALRKVAQVPPDELDEQVMLWARDVREASYDMEDILDTFLVRVDGDPKEPADANKVKRLVKKMGNLFSLSKGKARHQIANAVDELSKQLEEVAKLRGRYAVDDIVHKPTTRIDPRLSALYTKVSQLVGIDEQRDKLMQMLTEGDHDMQPNQKAKILSVVGVGGLGKTTLVKAVYDKLTMNNPYKAFVPVGQNPDLKKVLKDILIALDRDYMMAVNFTILDERQLIDELRDFLKDKRYTYNCTPSNPTVLFMIP
jgi:disease resistance protein RPM1